MLKREEGEIISLVPDFEIGLWNAWLLAVPTILIGWIFAMINREAGKRAMDTSWYTSKEKILMGLCVPFYIVMFYSIFVPLKLGTICFYIGLVVYILGFILLIISYFNFAASPLNIPVVKGIYKISRNPLYFFTAIVLLGASIASASWLMISLIVLWLIPQHFIILAEERHCLEKYGNAYREYMDRTPRYMGIPPKEGIKNEF